MALKKYNLKIVYNVKTGEITHLSEHHSDLDIINFEVDGRLVRVPREMQKLIEDFYDDNLGIC